MIANLIIEQNGIWERSNNSLPNWLKPFLKQFQPDEAYKNTLPKAVISALKKEHWCRVEDDQQIVQKNMYISFDRCQEIITQIPLIPIQYKYVLVHFFDFIDHSNRESVELISQNNPQLTWIVDFKDMIVIGDNYGYGFLHVKNVYLYGENILFIGSNFFKNCLALSIVDLSSLRDLTYVGACFFAICERLKNIDLSQLTKLEYIGDSFLHGCLALPHIDLSGFINVKEISESFLYGCSHLTVIDLSSLRKVKKIGYYFLSWCDELINVDLSALSDITSIGDRFCIEYSRHPLPGVDSSFSIPPKEDGILLSCKNATNVDFKFYHHVLTSVACSGRSSFIGYGDRFLINCRALKNVSVLRNANSKLLRQIEKLSSKVQINYVDEEE
ncbi:MAG: hypothetical protein NEHIOOID_01231 [Holosporales bacterium]